MSSLRHGFVADTALVVLEFVFTCIATNMSGRYAKYLHVRFIAKVRGYVEKVHLLNTTKWNYQKNGPNL